MEEKKARINVYLTDDLKEKAQKKAKSLNISMSALFLVALDNYLKQDDIISIGSSLNTYKNDNLKLSETLKAFESFMDKK